jgi:hypothetical protein
VKERDARGSGIAEWALLWLSDRAEKKVADMERKNRFGVPFYWFQMGLRILYTNIDPLLIGLH